MRVPVRAVRREQLDPQAGPPVNLVLDNLWRCITPPGGVDLSHTLDQVANARLGDRVPALCQDPRMFQRQCDEAECRLQAIAADAHLPFVPAGGVANLLPHHRRWRREAQMNAEWLLTHAQDGALLGEEFVLHSLLLDESAGIIAHLGEGAAGVGDQLAQAVRLLRAHPPNPPFASGGNVLLPPLRRGGQGGWLGRSLTLPIQHWRRRWRRRRGAPGHLRAGGAYKEKWPRNGPEESPLMALQVHTVVSMPFAENTYLFWRDGRSDAVVVDPGLEPGAILEALEERKLSAAVLLCTHGHSDHIAGNTALKRTFPDAPIIIGEPDAPLFTDPDLNLSSAFGFEVVSPPADQLVREGDVLDLAGIRFEVLDVPGHSPGHVVYVIRETPAIVVGG